MIVKRGISDSELYEKIKNSGNSNRINSNIKLGNLNPRQHSELFKLLTIIENPEPKVIRIRDGKMIRISGLEELNKWVVEQKGSAFAPIFYPKGWVLLLQKDSLILFYNPREKQFVLYRFNFGWGSLFRKPKWDDACIELQTDSLRTAINYFLSFQENLKGNENSGGVENISPQHKILNQILSKAESQLPSWGDGDEYPYFYLWNKESNGDDEFGDLHLDFQNGNLYRWKGKCWEEVENSRTPRRINNLKQELLKEINSYEDQWNSIDYLDKKKIDEVLNYLNFLKQEIKKSKL